MNPVQIILLIVSIAITIANRPRTPKTVPAAFEDFDFPQAEEGTPQCVVFGDVWIEDWTVLAYGHYEYLPVKKR